MSELRFNVVKGIVTGCANAITTVETIVAGCTELAVAAGAVVADARAAQHDYLRQEYRSREMFERERALSEQLGQCLVRQESVAHLQHHISHVLTAPPNARLDHARSRLAAIVHREQQAVVQEVLAPAIVQATQNTGFANVQQLRSPDRVLVIGEDQHGRALQHEVLAAPDQPLSITSETLNFPDQSCAATLDRFERSLREAGITIQRQGQTSTLRRPVRQLQRVRR